MTYLDFMGYALITELVAIGAIFIAFLLVAFFGKTKDFDHYLE